jgi:hypothetical protein
MRQTARPCLDQHLADKLKRPNVVPAADWFKSAERHFASAQLIINGDPAGALQMAWSAMHDIAKGAAAASGLRLDDETHGKVADFLACAYADELEDRELGLIRTLHGRRNKSSYDDPRVGQSPMIGAAVNLTARMIQIAIANLARPAPQHADRGDRHL